MNVYLWKNTAVAGLFLLGWALLVIVETWSGYSGRWIQIFYLAGIPACYVLFWLINTPVFARRPILLRFIASGLIATALMSVLLLTAVSSTVWLKHQLNLSSSK